MAYPGSIWSPATLTGASHPQASDVNAPNTEIVAMETAIGINPTVPTPVTPGASPTSIQNYLAMIAQIFKMQQGSSYWTGPFATPYNYANLIQISGHGQGATVPALGTTYGITNGVGLAASVVLGGYPAPWNGLLLPWTVQVETLTTQPADGYLSIDFLATAVKIPASTVAGINRMPYNTTSNYTNYNSPYTFLVNATLGPRFINFSPTAVSAQIGSWSFCIIQAG